MISTNSIFLESYTELFLVPHKTLSHTIITEKKFEEYTKIYYLIVGSLAFKIITTAAFWRLYSWLTTW